MENRDRDNGLERADLDAAIARKVERAKAYLRERGIDKPRVRISEQVPWRPFAPRTLKG